MSILKKIKDKTGTIHDLGDSRVDAFETELSGAVHNVPYSPAVLAKTNAIEASVSAHIGNTANPHKVTKAQIGLANVENKSSTQIRSELTKENVTNALGYTPIDESRIGAANGVASLDASGRIPASQIPGGFDNIEEYDSKTDFPTTGEEGKIYVAKDTNLTYRWTGSQYVEISPSLALGETATTAYRGDRGKVAYDHSQVSGNSTIHHTHANKELLDTYKQTEADLANAVAKVHEHGNKGVLDGITSSDVANWNSKMDSLLTNDITIANGDKLVVTDSSDSSKVARASIAFDGSTTTKALTQKGTWESFAKSGDITTAIQALDVSSVGGDGKYISAISETDGKISATAATMDSTPMANSTKAVTSGGIKTALDGKASKVANATSGNFAGLDANGNLTDSGHKHGDYALLNITYGTRGYITGSGSNPDLLLEKLKLGVIQLYQGTGVGIKLYEYDAGDEANAVLVWDSSTLTGSELQKFLNGQILDTIYTSTAGKCIKAEYNGHTAGSYNYCRAFGIFMTPKHADASHTATAVCRINGVTYGSYKINTYGSLVTAVCPDVNYTTVIVNFTPSATTTRMRFYGFRCLNTYDGENAVLLGRATSALSATKATQDSDGNVINATYATQERLDSHKNDTTVHITAEERKAWNAKQSALTFDTTPTAGSTNPVTSEGIKTALEVLQSNIDTVNAKGIVINEINGENVICFE